MGSIIFHRCDDGFGGLIPAAATRRFAILGEIG
jgi:hypothetical protein